jgi:glycosyl transferase family 2
MPKFTIGIPTYNRADLLPTALAAALNQSHEDVEVIVSDNASSDNTSEVVRQFGDRVRYFRNDTNLGPAANFCRLVDLATGEFFSWLQDDDCVGRDFAARAVAAFALFSEATLYGAYAAVSGKIRNLCQAWLYGPPVELDWTSGRPRSIRGDLLAPLSLCTSVVIPPTTAFRLDTLRDCMSRWNREIPLLGERTIVCDVAARGEAVFDPFVAGVFRAHLNQGYRTMQAEDPGALGRQWMIMARELNALPAGFNRCDRLVEILNEVSFEMRKAWQEQAEKWPEHIGICREMRQALNSKPPPARVPLSPSGIAKAGARAARAIVARVID